MYAIIPLGFMSKLLGALFFGQLGDRIGRAKIVALTLLGLALKSALMGFLPTYEQAGSIAPVLLVFSRLTLDFFSAGQTTGSSLFLMEHTEKEKRNFVSSLFDASGILGVIIASLVVGTLSPYPNFWRYLFWTGALVGMIGWKLRKTLKLLDEPGPKGPGLNWEGFRAPPKFGSELPRPKGRGFKKQDEQPKEKKKTWHILWQHRQDILSIAAVSGISYANYYLITSFMNGFLPLISPISKTEALSLNSLLLAVDLLLLPLFGILSLKIKKEKLMLFAVLAIILSAAPLLSLLEEATLFIAACVRLTFTLFGTCIAAPYHAWVYEKSSKEHRYLIGAVGSLIGAKLIGAPLPVLSLWLYHHTESLSAPALPLVVIGCFAIIPLLKKNKILCSLKV
jgi:MHS family proline/betaine transporter-like MFS transporter